MLREEVTRTVEAPAEKPAVTLYAYQKHWLADKARFKAACVTRQGGKSFMGSLEVADDAVATGEDWVLLSKGERQSKQLMRKCKMHLDAYGIAASDIQEDFFEDANCRQLTISLPNGANLYGLPANPDTARGYSANVLLDEFGIHKDSWEIWGALYPIITRGFKLRILSSPKGTKNKFASIMRATDSLWSRHVVDIYQAVREGLDANIDELKAGLDDEELWQQEYECKFLDEVTAFLTYDLIASCETDGLLHEISFEEFDPSILLVRPTGRIFVGVDIGRTRDRTVIWVLEQLGDVFATLMLFVLDNVEFTPQMHFLWRVIDALKADRCCIDATGIGAHLAEDTRKRYGRYKVEEVKFTNEVKNDLAVRMLRTFQDRRMRIPISRRLRDDLHAVKKTATTTGNIRFDAERTKDGHADRFWAGALALMASDDGVVKPEIIWA